MKSDAEIFAILDEIADNAPPHTTPQRRRGSNPAGPASPLLQSLPKPGPKRLLGTDFTRAFKKLWKDRTDQQKKQQAHRARLWVTASFLHAEHVLSGKGLNHEIEGPENNSELLDRLTESAMQMREKERKKMASVFLKDVHEAFNGYDADDCERLANRLHDHLLLEETIPGLRKSNFLRFYNGIWSLSVTEAHHVRQELRKVGLLAAA
ncbi:MAG: hypothetical protein JWN75_718 [Candidatus Saccharibacteria bacterium]|nr:hypothetical protein [Candidatus Saccharibacteria bacterium]